jgi:hypothetical protein
LQARSITTTRFEALTLELGAKIIDAGFSAVPCLPRAKIPGERKNGEWRRMPDWQRYADRLPTILESDSWTRWPDAGVCIVLGGPDDALYHVVAVDVDATDEHVIEAIRGVLPASPVERTGSKGYAGFYRASPSMVTATFDIDGKRAVDFLAKGRQVVVAPSIHPDTKRPYVWTGEKPLEDVTPYDLPILPDDFTDRLRAALAPFGDVKHTVDHRRSHDDDYCGPWTETNDAALDNLDAWLPPLGVQAKRERDGSYRGPAVWRGGDNPTSVSYDHRGIRDFKMNEGLTPLDVVQKAGAAEGDWNADNWLREKLGLPVLLPVKFEFGPLFGREFSGVISIPYSEGAWVLRSEAAAKAAKTGECMFQRIGFLDAKPREYLVKGFIPRNEVCNPFGRPDSFKGVSGTQLCVHIAGGVDFLGMHVKQAPTAYFAGERAEQVKRRIKGHIQRLGLPYDLPCYFGGKPIDLLNPTDLKILISQVQAIESDAGRPLGLLVVDTQSRTMGGDENSTKDGAAYAKAIEAVRQATEATLWVIAHTGHSEEAQDRPRGSSALLGAYDTFYRHKKIDEHSGEIRITIDRDGLGGKEFPFTVELYDTGAVNEDGEPVMVPYLEAAAPTVKIAFKKGDEPSKSESPTRAESEALRALRKAIKKHGLVTPKGEGIPAGEVTVCEREWRDCYYELFRTREQSTLRQGFSRVTKSLIAKGCVGEYGSRRWPAD